MEIEQLRASLVQVLETYQRRGLTRIGRLNAGELPREWLQGITGLAAQRETPVPAVSDSPSGITSQSPVRVARPAQSESESHISPAVRVAQRATESQRDASPAWNLPVLDGKQRQQRLDALDAEVKACRACSEIVSFRQQTVFGDGPTHPTVCFMGEAPGADEDRQGKPFVGKAGQLLSKIITAMKLNREEVYILNALKCRPPQNRTPDPEEIGNCRGFVEAQLAVLQPRYIVCLGAVAVRSILQSSASIGRLRGKFHAYQGARVIVTYHPSYLLRNESAKKLVWEDMQMLMRELGLK